MRNNLTKDKELFLPWAIISIGLIAIFTSYGNKLRNQYPASQEKAIQKLGWTITIIILLCIYITEQTISNIQERRLINSMIIFAGTFSYLYHLRTYTII